MLSTLRTLVIALVALAFVGPASAVQPIGSVAWTTDGWVTLTGTLYSGPGPRYDEVGAVGEGERVRVQQCRYRWCEIRTSSARGWLSLDNLDFGQSPGVLGPSFPTQRGGDGQVCFYSGAQFTGTSFCADSGRVFPDLKLIGMDNEVSSIEVGPGVSAVVCRDRNFRSYCETIDVSQDRLNGLLVRGVSSIRVY
jgi:uncharacterized protein YraI